MVALTDGSTTPAHSVQHGTPLPSESPCSRHLSCCPTPLFSIHPLQTNPVCWSRSLGPGGGLSAFGAGFFDDAADVSGTPVLFFALRCRFRPEDATVELVKVHTRPSPAPHRSLSKSLSC